MRILKDIDEAEQAISQLHAVARGRLRVNAAVAFATYQIVPILPEYLELYPQVQLELSVTDKVVDVVDEGVDVAIRLGARIDLADLAPARRRSSDHLRRPRLPRAPRAAGDAGRPRSLQLPQLDR